jgi:ribonuclease BN (tRNA processing enzyme)
MNVKGPTTDIKISDDYTMHVGESNLIVTTAGVGGAWATKNEWQNQVMLEIAGLNRKYLVDCSGDARHSLGEINVNSDDIYSVVVSHLHGDHVDGLEWLGFKNVVFNKPLINLFFPSVLKEGLTKIFMPKMGNFENGQTKKMDDYFNMKSCGTETPFVIDCGQDWSLTATYIAVPHVNEPSLFSSFKDSASFALLIKLHEFQTDSIATVLLSNDCRYCPNILTKYMVNASLIFHDASVFGGVHAKYDDLKNYPEAIRKKMILYHSSMPLPNVSELFMGQAIKGASYRVPYNFKVTRNSITSI